MPTTPLGLVYPASTDNVQIWTHLQTLADGVDALVTADRDRLTAAETGHWRAGQTASIVCTNASGHAEAFGASAMITATLVAGHRYRVSYEGSLSGTAGDACFLRLRYKAGATVDSAGTQLTGGLRPEYAPAVTGRIQGVRITGEFLAPLSAQYTVGVSVQWYAGGANDITLYATPGTGEPLLTMDRIATA